MAKTRGGGREETNERGKDSSRKMQPTTEPLGRRHPPSSAPSVRGRGRPLPSRSSEAFRPLHSPDSRQVQSNYVGDGLQVNDGIEEVDNEESNTRVPSSVVVPRRSRYSDSHGLSFDGIQGPNGVVPTPSPALNPSGIGQQVPSPSSIATLRVSIVVPIPPPIAEPGCSLQNPNPSPVASLPESSRPISRPVLMPTSDRPELREGVLWFDMRLVTNKICQSIQVQFNESKSYSTIGVFGG